MECETACVDSERPPVGKKLKPTMDESQEYDELVSQLASRLKLARHPKSSITLHAARLLTESLVESDDTKFGFGSCKDESKSQEMKCQDSLKTMSVTRGGDTEEIRIQQSKFVIDDIPVPASIMSRWQRKLEESQHDSRRKEELCKAFERASKALKLLYLDDQKQLQYRVNEVISCIQSITANPKIDTKLLAGRR